MSEKVFLPDDFPDSLADLRVFSGLGGLAEHEEKTARASLSLKNPLHCPFHLEEFKKNSLIILMIWRSFSLPVPPLTVKSFMLIFYLVCFARVFHIFIDCIYNFSFGSQCHSFWIFIYLFYPLLVRTHYTEYVHYFAGCLLCGWGTLVWQLASCGAELMSFMLRKVSRGVSTILP